MKRPRQRGKRFSHLAGVLAAITLLTALSGVCQAEDIAGEELSIAMDTSWVPYCFVDDSGEVQGIIRNILDAAAEKVDMRIRYVPHPSYGEALDAVKSEACQVVSGVAQNHRLAVEKEVQISRPYITISYSAVTKNVIEDLYNQEKNYRVAVCKGSYSTALMKEQMSDYRFVEYDSNTQCIDAVNKEKVDMALIASYASQYYLSQAKYRNLTAIPINEYTWRLCFGFNNSVDPAYIERLNKGLDALSVAETNQAIYSGILSANTANLGLDDYLYQNPAAIVSLAVIVLAMGVLVTGYLMRRKRREREKLAQMRTELAIAEERDRMRSSFFSNMSHDLRTPMNGIMGLTQLAQDAGPSPEIAGYLREIHASGQYLMGLLGDILTLTQMEQKQMLLYPGPVEMEAFLQSVAAIAQGQAAIRGLQFRFSTEGEVEPYQKFDRQRVQQVLLNVLNNAVKYTPEGGSVSYTYRETERSGTVWGRHTITDTGVGMSQEFIQNGLFQPFRQEHNSQSAASGGTGLGLSISKTLVDLMGGSISVVSQPGKGSTFQIELPAAPIPYEEYKAAQPAPAKDGDIRQALSGRRVLLCEDHPLNMQIAKKLLEKVGICVEWAKNGQEAVDRFRADGEAHYDAVLMDIRMPVMDGLEATRNIRAMERADVRAVPIIAMSANAFEEDVQRSLAAGMNTHLSKPIDPQVLYRVLVEQMQRAQG